MTIRYLQLPVLLLMVYLLQACSSTGEKNLNLVDQGRGSFSKVEQSLARDIGKLYVGERLTTDSSNDVSAHEYFVADSYIAASGRSCREVEITPLDGKGEIKTAVLCQKKKSGDWYWPRDVIFK